MANSGAVDANATPVVKRGIKCEAHAKLNVTCTAWIHKAREL